MILALFCCQMDIIQHDTRAFAHPAEGAPFLQEEHWKCIELSDRDGTLIYNADTVIGDDGPQTIRV